MSFSREQVNRVAHLARLELTAAEEEQFAAQLGSILEYIERLTQLDTSGVVPTTAINDLREDLRDDVVTNPEAGSTQLWRNAPAWEDQQFRVPKIIES